MKAYRTLQLLVLAGVLAAGVAACGSSNNSGASASPSTSKPATSAPATSASAAASGSAAALITKNWEAFFSAKTPVAKRVALLQNGQVFAAVIRAQAGSSLASSASAKVTKVTVTSPTHAKVTYSILVGGSPALPNQSGVAILQGGTWKVGLASFCSLLTLENNGKTSGLPALCKSAG
ncbi:MAG TPA: hypothetical protein VMH35_11745 [Streptosporangiaceae bacterium]|nr:hypothetical protein [Streptosporangiaceae bacterium]